MASKVLEMAIAIRGKLDGGLSSSVSKATAELDKLSNSIKDQQRYVKQLESAQKKLGEGGNNSVLLAEQEKLNSLLQRQTQLRGQITSQQSHQAAISKLGGASPVASAASAAQGASAAVSGVTAKLANLAMVAAGGFGLGAIIENVVNAGEALYQLSNKLHMSTADVAQFKKMMTLSGVDVEVAAKSFSKMDKVLSSGGKSAEALQAYLGQFGVTLTDANGHLLPMNQQLDAMAAGYQKANAEGRGQEFMLQTLGAKGIELTKVFENYADAKAAASQIKGVGLDPKALHETWLQMNILKAEASQVGLGLAAAFVPIAQQILPALVPVLQQVVVFIQKNQDTIAMLVTNGMKLALLYGVATKLASGITTITVAFQGVESASKAFKVASGMIGGPWVIAIMAIITALYLLYTNWDTIVAAVTDIWNRLSTTVSSAFSSVVTSVGNAVQSVVNALVNIPSTIAFVIGFIAGVLPQLPAIMAATGSAFVDATINFVSEAYAIATSWIENLVSTVADILTNLPSYCADAGSAFVAAAEQWASDAYNAVINWIERIPAAVSDAISGAWDSIKAQFSGGFTVGVEASGGDVNAYANGGVITSPEMALVGEAGYPEVIVPIDGSANAMALWQTAGRMLGVSGAQQAPSVSLAPSVPMATGTASSGDVNITFAPVIQGGTGSTDDMMAALDAKMREFAQMMSQYSAGQRRLSYD